MKKTKKPKVIVTTRIDVADLAKLDKLGMQADPVPASRSEMIQAAVRAYIEQHAPARRPPGKR